MVNLTTVTTLVVIAYIFVGWVCYGLGIKQGLAEGVDNYHRMCYTIGGIVVDENTGTAVQCSPLGKVPKEEVPNFFPKGVDKTM